MGREEQEYIDTDLPKQESTEAEQQNHRDRYQGLALRLLKPGEVKPYENSVPIYDLDIAAGLFSETQLVNEALSRGITTDIESYQWVELPDSFRTKRGQFVARVVGESMNKRIPNGSWCLFRLNPSGTRQGKVLLVQHRSIDDPDTGGHYTIKVYESEKEVNDDGGWKHRRITLKPDSTESRYRPIVFEATDDNELVVIAELVAVLC